MNYKKKITMVSLATLMVVSQMTGYSYIISKADEGNKVEKFYISPGVNSGNIYIKNKNGETVKIDGSGTAVGVLDDAIKDGHPALSKEPTNPKYPGKGKIIKALDWSNKLDTELNNIPFESYSGPFHGMHVSGIIGANGEFNDKYFLGVAPETQIIFEKVQSYKGDAMIKDNEFADAIRDISTRGADSINLSLGVESATMNQANVFNDAIIEVSSRGVPVISTAGNQGYFGFSKNKPLASNPDYGTVSRSGISPECICVGSVYNSYHAGRTFSIGDEEGKFRYFEARLSEAPRFDFNKSIKSKNNEGYVESVVDKDLDYVVIDNPNDETLNSANVNGKIIVIPREIKSYEYQEGDNKNWPKYLIIANKAEKLGCKGVIIYNNVDSDSEASFIPQIYSYESRTSPNYWDEWYNLSVYLIGVSESVGQKLKNSSKKTININDKYRLVSGDTRSKDLGNFSSRGVSSDFLFKPDIVAPSAGSVYSTVYVGKGKNKKYAMDNMVGTSMGAPQVSAGAALVKQRLKEQYPELVKSDLRTTHLIKNLLMSTAVPSKGKNEADEFVYYSPRGQGNGVMDVGAACHTDVITVSPKIDNDTEKGFSKTNLRMIDNHTISFDIELQNYGSKSYTYTPKLNVMVDEVNGDYYTMKSKYLEEGKVMNKVTVPARDKDSIEPGKATVSVQYKLKDSDLKLLNEQSKNGFFVDGFVTFEPDDKNDESAVPLVHSFTGFEGNWFKAPIHEKYIYDMKDGEKPFYSNIDAGTNLAGRDGTMNSTHLESFIGDKRVVLGAMPDFSSKNISVSDKNLTISPNGDKNFDTVNPTFVMLRNYEEIILDIRNSDNKQVFSRKYGLGVTDKKKNYFGDNPLNGLVFENPKNLQWDGKDVSSENVLPEDEYTYKTTVTPDLYDKTNPASEKMTEKYKPEPITKEFKVKLDLTPPVLEETNVVEKDGKLEVSFNAKDPNLSGKNIPGSGIYKAYLIKGDETIDLKVDPKDPDSLSKKKVIMTKEEFEHCKLKLVDWGKNSEIYMPKLTIHGLDVGALQIKSINENGETINVRYKVKNLSDGEIYNTYSKLPIGEYSIIPLNPQEGYFIDKKVNMKVSIKKDKKIIKTIPYSQTILLSDILISSGDFLKDGYENAIITLTDVKTGVEYDLKKNSRGEFSGKVKAGIYKIGYENFKKNDDVKIFDGNNLETDYIKADITKGLSYYDLTLGEDSNNEVENIDVSMKEYLKGQTFIKINGNRDSKVGVEVLTANLDDYEATLNPVEFTISEENGDSVYELKDKYSKLNADYIIDLSDSAIEKLKEGMILRPYYITEDGVKHYQDGNKLNVVGTNKIFERMKIKYLMNLLEKNENIDEEKKSELKTKLESISYKFLRPEMNAGRGSLVGKTLNWLADEYVLGEYKDANEKLGALYDELYKVLGISEDDIPVLSVHLGYFPKIKTLEYLAKPEMKNYSGVDVPTTKIINNKEVVDSTMADIYKDAETFGRKDDLLPDEKNEVSVLKAFNHHKSIENWGSDFIKKDGDVYKFNFDEGTNIESHNFKPSLKEYENVDSRPEFDEFEEVDMNTQPDKKVDKTHETSHKTGGSSSSSNSGSTIVNENNNKEQTVKELLEKVSKKRVSGNDRIKTSLEVSKKYFNKSDKVILVRDDVFADSLSASALAGKYNCPIILTNKKDLRQDVLNEVKRLGAKEVILIGGENSISPSIEKNINEFTKTLRIADKDRYATARKIAEKLLSENNSKKVIIASGEDFADALSISPYASQNIIPILLVNKNGIDSETRKIIKDHKIEDVIVVGGENTIPSKILDNSEYKVMRIAGKNRYETSREIARKLFPKSERAFLTSGEKFADALSIGGVAGKNNSPVLLQNKKVSKEDAHYIKNSNIKEIILIGGENSIESVK